MKTQLAISKMIWHNDCYQDENDQWTVNNQREYHLLSYDSFFVDSDELSETENLNREIYENLIKHKAIYKNDSFSTFDFKWGDEKTLCINYRKTQEPLFTLFFNTHNVEKEGWQGYYWDESDLSNRE
jgi:hypothetical protein